MSDSLQLPCRHGSLWCGRCRHNTASPMSVPGRPKYQPSRGAHKTGYKGRQRKRGSSRLAS